MTSLTLELPEAVLQALHLSPAEFPGELRLAAAVTWYKNSKISQEIAAQIAGLSRADFLDALARMKRDSFRVDFEDLDRELSRSSCG